MLYLYRAGLFIARLFLPLHGKNCVKLPLWKKKLNDILHHGCYWQCLCQCFYCRRFTFTIPPHYQKKAAANAFSTTVTAIWPSWRQRCTPVCCVSSSRWHSWLPPYLLSYHLIRYVKPWWRSASVTFTSTFAASPRSVRPRLFEFQGNILIFIQVIQTDTKYDSFVAGCRAICISTSRHYHSAP